MRYLLLFLFFCCWGAPLAQGQVMEAGYLVFSTGDTLRGEVENAFWEDPPTTVRFRTTPTAPLVTYLVPQVRTIYLASNRLLRYEVLPLDRTAETEITRLRTGRQSYQHPEALMADVLVIGPAMLLGVTLNNVKHFFVRREAQPFFEMTERNYLVSRRGALTIADGNDYRSQLLLYFGDCSAAAKAAEKVPFTAKGLRQIVQLYNQQCSAARQSGREIAGDNLGRAKSAIRLGITGGVRYNSLRFEQIANATNSLPGLNGLNADGRMHVQAGGYADIVNPGRRLALHAALQLSRFGGPTAVDFHQGQAGAVSFKWHGTLIALQVGLRGFLPVGAHYQLLFGGGYELNAYSNPVSGVYYAGEKSEFIGGFNGTLLPYIEAGLSRNRVALVLNSRQYATQFYESYLVNPWSLSMGLSYRLNADSDKNSVVD